MSWEQRRRYKEGLVEAFATAGEAFHIVAKLPPGASRETLEDRLYHWTARINRRFVGRLWYRSHFAGRRMTGVVFFETRGAARLPHAHLIVRPPAGIHWIRFQQNARFWFEPHPEPCFQGFFKSVTRRGQMWVRRINPNPQDRARVIRYVAKDLEGDPKAVAAWKFLEDLNRQQVVTI